MKPGKIQKQLAELPKVLEEQIYTRCGSGLAALVVGIVFVCASGIYLALPWFMLGAYLLVSGLLMAGRCLTGGYTRIEGVCTAIERVGLRKRIRTVVLEVDDIPMRVLVRSKRQSSIHEGDTVTVYTADSTPVYVKEGYDYICSYYALQVKWQ